MHEFDPNRAPDSQYQAGDLKWLVVGNRCRSLDPRRTPMRIIGIDLAAGMFSVELEAFEDKGAVWEIPFERLHCYQFEQAAKEADAVSASSFLEAVARLDVSTEVTATATTQTRTTARLAELERECSKWLSTHSEFFSRGGVLELDQREGPPELADDFRRFMESHKLWEMEAAFATQYVRNPYSGELLKGHRIVIAELGIVPYRGNVVRGKKVFDGPWSKHRRGEHILRRLAFVRAVLRKAGRDQLVLYRGICCDGPPRPPSNHSFVSTSTQVGIALSCSGQVEPEKVGVVYRQPVPIERVFISYLETAQMNERYKESEVVLLFDENNAVF